MKISYSKKHLAMSDNQLDYITSKIEHLKKLAKRVNDDSSFVDVDIEKLHQPPNNIQIKVNMKVPNGRLIAQSAGKTAEEAIDLCEEKLKNQIEKYKAKFGKNDMHNHNKVVDEGEESNGFEDLIED